MASKSPARDALALRHKAGEPLTLDELRAIGITPKGFKSSEPRVPDWRRDSPIDLDGKYKDTSTGKRDRHRARLHIRPLTWPALDAKGRPLLNVCGWAHDAPVTNRHEKRVALAIARKHRCEPVKKPDKVRHTATSWEHGKDCPRYKAPLAPKADKKPSLFQRVKDFLTGKSRDKGNPATTRVA